MNEMNTSDEETCTAEIQNNDDAMQQEILNLRNDIQELKVLLQAK